MGYNQLMYGRMLGVDRDLCRIYRNFEGFLEGISRGYREDLAGIRWAELWFQCVYWMGFNGDVIGIHGDTVGISWNTSLST